MNKMIYLVLASLIISCSTPTAGDIDDEQDYLEQVPVSKILDAVSIDGRYTTKDSVAAYICKFDKLPKNFVGKNEGKRIYEEKTGTSFSKWNFNPWTTIGYMIGGDPFENREGLLPDGQYNEADVDYSAANRGTKRLIYKSNCNIYYTADHYSSFKKINF